MKPTPLVSVVLPLGNTVVYAPLAFWSIHNQTFLDWECITVVDGGSEALDIAHRMSEIDERIKVYPNHSKGLVSALNLGISLSRGTY
ncbi:MAG: glycosyltransferase family 2 protein, partial [Acidimicrobiaceae bacterium]|nr:glycosyltransferase family 2 protein [Acidimicrobiaceae bacterium]